MKVALAAITLVITCSSSPAWAQSATSGGALIEAIVRCKAEADENARLRCYDSAAGALSEARASGSIMVVDKAEVRKARRSLFGFSLPKLPFFAGDDSADDQPDEMEATIAGARGIGYGKWMLELDTGAKWQTTESARFQKDPRPGDKIKIKKGVMGSYFLSIDGRRGLRGMRIG